VLSRNGKEFSVTGATNVRAGTEIKVATERPSVPLTLTELDRGSWVIFELPGFTTAASGTPQNSLDALRQASDTSYYKGQDSLWVKVVSSGDAGNGAPGGEPASRSAGKLFRKICCGVRSPRFWTSLSAPRSPDWRRREGIHDSGRLWLG